MTRATPEPSTTSGPSSAGDSPLVDLPPHEAVGAWPTLTWATGCQLSGDPDRLELVLDRAMRVNPNPDLAQTLAVVVVQGGRVVAERYAERVLSTTRLRSWSVAKSITQAAVGLATGEGTLDIDQVPASPTWDRPDDNRRDISVRHLLAMRSGLEFNEDYVDVGTSHCLEMLFGAGADDMGRFAASQQLVAPVNTEFNYSSGSTNIVSQNLASIYGPGEAGIGAWLRSRLLEPLGMESAVAHYDGAGTFVGSSYVDATARDFARFGYLYLRDGFWDGVRLLPEGWVDLARTPHSIDTDTGLGYGSGWWVWNDEFGTFAAQGYEGQLVAVVPALDLVVVRLGKTPVEHRPALFEFYRQVIESFVDS